MKRLSYSIIRILIVSIGLSLPFTGFGQISDPGCDPFDPTCPIDGGLSFLLAAGVGLAARKAFKASKQAVLK